jgi:hypothetical protein
MNATTRTRAIAVAGIAAVATLLGGAAAVVATASPPHIGGASVAVAARPHIHGGAQLTAKSGPQYDTIQVAAKAEGATRPDYDG